MPYTYLIGWRSMDVWYYGVRYAQGCTPSDLWVSYFTSSEHVKAFRELHGDPDVVEVRKVFPSPELARAHEERVLRRLKAIASPRWLNRSYGGVKFVGCGGWNKGIPLSDAQKDKLREANLGKKLNASHREKISASQKGKKRSAEARANIAAAQSIKKGIPRSEEARRKMKEAWEVRRTKHASRPHSDETKEKIRAAALKRAAHKYTVTDTLT